MSKKSAGILLYRYRDRHLEVFLVHPGGPFWVNRDAASWSIPKGEYDDQEDPLLVARREFREETGFEVTGELVPLEPVKQPGGKVVTAWAVEGECDSSCLKSNLFTMQWPPRSGKFVEVPEVDRGEWFGIAVAKEKILKGQLGLIDQLCARLGQAG